MNPKPNVLITIDMPRIAYDKLSGRFNVTWNKPQLDGEQLLKKVKRYDALLTTLGDQVTDAVMAAAPRLKIVSNMAVGFNNIDLVAARKRGIVVTNTPDVLTDATADLAWALLMASARRLPEGERLALSGKFHGVHSLMLLGVDLKGKTLGIYGCGRIGQAVARRSLGWDMKVIYHNRHTLPKKTEKALNARWVPFGKLLKDSDFLCVVAPLTPETRGRFTLREFKQMKLRSVFVNIGRGPIHNEKDLATALRKGWIGYAGLDVYEHEPKIERELLRSNKVTLLPHIGSATVETRDAMASLAADNILRVLSGRKPLTPVP